MKKNIILLCIIFLLTGCNVEYNVTISNDKIDENISVYTDTLNFTSESDGNSNNINNIDYYAYNLSDSKYKYNKTIKKSNNMYEINLTYSHNPNEFINSTALNYFKYHSFINDEKYYYIKLQDGLKNGYKDKISKNVLLKITTNNKVVQNNADKIDGNTYIWEITKQNADEKEILFQVMKNEKNDGFVTKSNGNVLIMGSIAIFIVTVLIVLIYLGASKLFNYKFRR